MSKSVKIVAVGLAALAAAAIVLLVTGIVVVQTRWFKNLVRARIVSVVERATGGRVEIGSFSYNWHELTAEVKPFVVHGNEPSTAPPLFRADSVKVGLKVVSALEKKVDISSLIVDRPQIYITIGPDGATNIPHPKIARLNQNVIEDLLDLKVQHIELRRGEVDYNTWRVPLDASGERLQTSLVYQPAGPSYLCAISSALMRIESPKLRNPAEFALDSQVQLGRNAIQVLRMNLSSGGMKLNTTGTIANLFAPRLDFNVDAVFPVRDLNQLIETPLASQGELKLVGHAFAGGSASDRFVGKISGQSLAYAQNRTEVRDVSLAANADLTPQKFILTDVVASSRAGSFRGTAQIADLKHVALNGEIEGLTITEAGRLLGRDTGTLRGTLSGPLELNGDLTGRGFSGTRAAATLDLKPAAGGLPVAGSLAVNYDQRAGLLQLGNSQLDIGSTHADFSGTLGRKLILHVVSRNLNDPIPVLHALGIQTPARWPVELHGGAARMDAVVDGIIAKAKISGKADADHLMVQGHQLDRAAATFNVDASSAVFQALTVDAGKMHFDGKGRAGLHDWKLDGNSPVSADVSLSSADVQTLAAQAGFASSPVSGLAAAAIHVSGSLEAPVLASTVTLADFAAYGEKLGQAHADVTFTTTALEIAHGEARNGPARFSFAGAYNHPAKDWQDGSLRFDVAAAGVDVAQVQHLQSLEQGLGGRMNVNASGGAKIVNGRLDLTSLNGALVLRNALVNGRSYGDLSLTAATQLPLLTISATATLPDVQFHARGEWRMEGDYQGEAHLTIPRISFATLHDLAPGKHVRSELPFEGYVEGEATIAGPLNNPSAMNANVLLSAVQLRAKPKIASNAAATEDLVLRNAQPVRIIATTKSIDFGRTSFSARDTTIDATGRLLLDSKNSWDLAIQGRIDFAILQIFNPDLLGSGTSILNVAVHGPLLEPQVEGRLDLRSAALSLRDFPNGLTDANGVILFDRNRATVQSLSGKSGGGEISFDPGSFLGFRGPALVYRLQANARQVRYRSPQGLSVTANGSLSLVGTSDSSVLSGSVSITSALFGPQTDLGAMLASTRTPAAVSSNPYLPGLQFDVHVVTQRSLEIQTALSRNIRAEADLRVRGTPDHPVLLGNLNINSGQIEFFGNKYTINRGEINFNNAARIEPVLNMDLSTQVRGITVDILFSGPLNKLSFSYRSDPPLEAADIIALLAVGRTPSSAGPLALTQQATNVNNSYLGLDGGSDSLLSQAIAPNSGRLQKFFGVSHIKIDPQLTDVTIVPQARLTMEQQISSDVTLTYVTNLAVTNQQLVRIEWDFSRKWSAVALRDENGAFSIDFQYRKRFK